MVENQEYQNTKPYTGLGDYEISFDYSETSDVVVKWVSAVGVDSAAKTEGADYSIVSVGAYSYVRVLINYGTLGTIVYYREMPLTQTFQGVDGTEPSPSAIMIGMDRIVWICQQIYGKIFNAIKAPSSETVDMTLPNAATRAAGILGFGALPNAEPVIIAGIPSTAVTTYIAPTLAATSEAEVITADVLAPAGLAGAGRTTETVMANAAAIIALAPNAVTYSPPSLMGSLSIVNAGGPSMAPIGNGDKFAYIDAAGDSLQSYAIRNGSIVAIGSTASFTCTTIQTLAPLTETDISCLVSNGQIRTYRFSGTAWAAVGNLLTMTTGIPQGHTRLSSNTVAMTTTDTIITTYYFDGTDWAEVGTSLAMADSGGKLATLNETDVVMSNVSRVCVYRYSGGVWSDLSGDLSPFSTDSVQAITALNSTDILCHTEDDMIHIHRWNGTTFDKVYEQEDTSGGGILGICALSHSDYVSRDTDTDLLRYHRFGVTLNSQPPLPRFE